jgi:hypothetical protein
VSYVALGAAAVGLAVFVFLATRWAARQAAAGCDA